MFGSYNVPFAVADDDVNISIKEDGKAHIYKRTSRGETVEKIILAEGERVVISPVEPVNTPKKLAMHLLLEFKKDILIEPKCEMNVYVKFPVEFGVVIFRKKAHELLDVFSLVNPKYTLYGTPGRGTICRYWLTDVYMSKPDVDKRTEGVMNLDIKNDTHEWVTVRKAVFSAVGMKIYYDANNLISKAFMTVTGSEMAETDFYENAPEKGMKKCVELYMKKKLSTHMTKHHMEEGLI